MPKGALIFSLLFVEVIKIVLQQTEKIECGHGWDNNNDRNSSNAQILILIKTTSQYTGSSDDNSGPVGPGGSGGEGIGEVTNDGGG
ncbi:hypothetical protein EDD11_006470 [Mortierella claussenii]|nr:hypothetical protein EDD11_006470 [Mortierella claussenii]